MDPINALWQLIQTYEIVSFAAYHDDNGNYIELVMAPKDLDEDEIIMTMPYRGAPRTNLADLILLGQQHAEAKS